MDYWKFEDLLKTGELYFCRADKFTDSLEGTLSPEGIHGTSASDHAFSAVPGLGHDGYHERAAYRARAKACTFVSCWHINEQPDRRMWDAYTKSSDSVVMVTSADRLAASLKQHAFGSAVKYVSADTPRTEFDERSLFFYKDSSFAFEQEFRLVVDLMILGGTIREDDPNDFFRRFPVDLDTLIYGIQLHPDAEGPTKAKLGELIKRRRKGSGFKS
jgi:hypothetical protein